MSLVLGHIIHSAKKVYLHYKYYTTVKVQWKFSTTTSTPLLTRPLNAAQRAKIAEKVHEPPLGINVINFEFNGFYAFI